MDQNVLKIRAAEVAESLRSFLQAAAGSLAEDQEEQSIRLEASLRSTEASLDKRQSDRDSQVLSEVAAKNKAVRDDVERFGKETSDAMLKQIDATASEIYATIRAERAALHGRITEEIAVAVRANYEILKAEIQSRGGKS